MDYSSSNQKVFYFSRTPRMSSSRRISLSSPSTLTSVPPYLPKSTRSPTLTSSFRTVPSSWTLPLPTARTSPSMGFSLAESGMMMPLLLFFDTLDDDAVLKRTDVAHGCVSPDVLGADAGGRGLAAVDCQHSRPET